MGAERDILFDSVGTFSIGADAPALTGTEPVITFNGGDDANAGITFDIIGGMSWTINRADRTSFINERATYTAAQDISLTTNGPVRFLNEGEFDDASLTILTQALLNLQGGSAVEIASDEDTLIQAFEDIIVTATGNGPTDISVIRSNNDFVVDTSAFTTTTGNFNGEVIDVNGPMRFINTAGDGGSFTFDADGTLKATSVGPMTLEASGPAFLSTIGANSNINVISAGNQNLISGGALVAEGNSVDIDAPNGIAFTTVEGNLNLVASDNIIIRANQTLSGIGKDLISIRAGFENPSPFLEALVNITSRGTLNVLAQQDLDFTVTGELQDIVVIADDNLLLENSIPTRPSEQGDIVVKTTNYFTASDADSILNTNRNLREEANVLRYESKGEMIYQSTNANSATLIDAFDDFIINAEDDLSLSAMMDLTILGDELTWEQVNEDGFGGIYVTSTGPDAPVTLLSQEEIVFQAQNRIRGDSDQYLLFDAATTMTVNSYAPGGDVIYANRGTGGLLLTGANLNSQPAAGERLDIGNRFQLNALGESGDGVSIQLNVSNNLIMNVDDSDYVIHANTIELRNPKVDGTDIQVNAGGIAIIGNGIGDNGADADRSYGVRFEADDDITFSARNVNLESLEGAILYTASEDFTLKSTTSVDISAGDNVVISTGFTPQPNNPIPGRSGIVFTSRSESRFQSNQGDILWEAQDVSWSITGSLTIRSGGTVGFRTTQSPLEVASGNDLLIESEDADVTAVRDINLSSNTRVDIISRERLALVAEAAMTVTSGDLEIRSFSGDIYFHTPQGYVEFDDRFSIPTLSGQGGVSGIGDPFGDAYRFQEV